MQRRQSKITIGKRAGLLASLCAFLLVAGATGAAAEKKKKQGPVQTTEDGLELVPETKIMAAWVKPGANFSGYDKVMITEAPVSLVKGWAANHNRTSVNRVTDRDVQRIQDETSKIFREAFTKELSVDGAFEVVDTPGDDVLLLKPAIVDLDVTAPETRGTGMSYSFASSAGAATLYLELFDSLSGDILARAVDRQTAQQPAGQMRISTSASNRAQAERIFGDWAALLRDGLEEMRSAPSKGK